MNCQDFYNRHAHAIGRAAKLGKKAGRLQDIIDRVLDPISLVADNLRDDALETLIEQFPADGFYRLELRTLLLQRQRGVTPPPPSPAALPDGSFREELAEAREMVKRRDLLMDAVIELLTPATKEISQFDVAEIYRFLDRIPRSSYCHTELQAFVVRKKRGLHYEMVL